MWGRDVFTLIVLLYSFISYKLCILYCLQYASQHFSYIVYLGFFISAAKFVFPVLHKGSLFRWRNITQYGNFFPVSILHPFTKNYNDDITLRRLSFMYDSNSLFHRLGSSILRKAFESKVSTLRHQIYNIRYNYCCKITFIKNGFFWWLYKCIKNAFNCHL